ncbi:MAG: hypothetical protein EBT36_02095 [Betaproteobacteria bacterium]|nr:hypothetical protein [Betaproteobacteria bacterium]
MSQVEDNRANVRANSQKLFELESTVMWNKAQAYRERAMIEENRALIFKNYSAAFMGNRQMANQNTDDIFRNRKAILQSTKVEGAIQENFRDSMLNQAHIDFLDHRSKLNARVIAVSEKMSEINKMLIEVNHIAGNIEMNRKWLDGDLHPEQATPETNAERIASNASRIAEIQQRATANRSKIDAVMGTVEGNRAAILKNAEAIYERRQSIVENHKKIAANQERITKLIAG